MNPTPKSPSNPHPEPDPSSAAAPAPGARERSLLQLVLVVGIVALVAALIGWALRSNGPPPVVVDAETHDVAPAPRTPVPSDTAGTTKGGSYGGRVVDAATGKGIPDADVLLVATDEGKKVVIDSLEADGTGDPLEIPVFGSYKTSIHRKTGPDGAFDLPAGSDRVVAIFAYERAHAPGMISHTRATPLAPGREHVIRLAAAGWFKGLAVDAVTREPVGNVDVSVYLQTIANRDGPGAAAFASTNAFSRFQSWIAEELGPRVWGVQPRAGDSAMHVTTKADGTFEFGPVMKEVQLEFVLTHPDYMWSNYDELVTLPSDNEGREGQAPLTRRLRTTIEPGQTVEKTFPLERGREVRGTVVDSTKRPIQGVDVSLEHVVQAGQHLWYRFRQRHGTTDKDGRFHIAGLSHPPYTLHMTHPSFDSYFAHGVKDGTDDTYVMDAAGWLEASVEDGPADKERYAASISVIREGTTVPIRRLERVTVEKKQFVLEKLPVGRYDVTFTVGKLIAAPVTIDVRAGEATRASFRLEAAGTLAIPVRDARGQPIDPVTVELEAVTAAGASKRAGILSGREGVATAEGVAPGRYVAHARALGYVEGASAPFDVARGQTTNVETIVLHRQAYLRIASLKDEEGRTPTGVVVRLAVVEAGSAERPIEAVRTGLLPVTPGSVVLKAEAGDGRRFERTYEVGDGETVPVEIVLTR